ncbi:low affinity sulfate transporter 3-like [Momordica charantia]|uniref:Low affinity sulfate transporter 3-like n=1 Tax=Momordica charantia TaxID=3673 RepID=A0A6J1C634_MOMCH|nr:low affinity sulfate transporter 3-like [Momordica charantia]
MSVANADTPPALSEASTVGDTHAPDVEKSSSPTDRARWVANPPEPPGLWRELVDSLRDTVFPDPTKLLISIKKKTGTPLVASVFQAFFPILSWGRNYSAIKFKNDVLAGLTLASLCIPQSIGYATLAKLEPQYGLYTSIVPPLVYAVLGSSREIAIGPVAIVSLLLPAMIQNLQHPAATADPVSYTTLVLTATFFAGIFQASFGLLRSLSYTSFSSKNSFFPLLIVMAITVMVSLELFTKLLYFTPNAILASIILSALPGLVDLHEAYNIWKIDKLDFFALLGAFVGVLFFSVEIGLLLSIVISFAKIIVISIKPGAEILGKVPGTDNFCDVHQYPMAVNTPGVFIVRVKSGLLCFANANFVKHRIQRYISSQEDASTKRPIHFIVIDLSNLMNIDTSGIASLEELHKSLAATGIELAIANPKWQVIHKLKVANFVAKLKGRVFLSVGEAVDSCLSAKMGDI